MDRAGWGQLMAWLGEAGRRIGAAGTVEVVTRKGRATAAPGDWIVLSVSGDFHVAFAGGESWDA